MVSSVLRISGGGGFRCVVFEGVCSVVNWDSAVVLVDGYVGPDSGMKLRVVVLSTGADKINDNGGSGGGIGCVVVVSGFVDYHAGCY